MTDRDPTLVQLGIACGIAASYWDARGELHYPPESTLRHLLQAMRVIDSTGADATALGHALAHERSQRWQRTLAPVRVLYDGEACGIEIVVASDALDDVLNWHVVREDGELIDGEARAADLPMAGEEGGGGGSSRARIDDRALELRWLVLPALPQGYHTLRVQHATGETPGPCDARLIVAPRRCHDQPGLRVWGPAVQLYALRSARNQGIGDYTDLADACRMAGSLGADVLGINPLHALFAHDPESASPYSPSSRLFLNTACIALDAVPGYQSSDDTDANGKADEFIDYGRVFDTKQGALEGLHARFLDQAGEPLRAFSRWRQDAGEALERFALFEALRERNAADPDQPTSAWWDWPDGLDDPNSQASRTAADELADRVDHHAWLQWCAATQLEAAAASARDAGLGIGLYRDLAVGTAAGGSDAWAAQSAYLTTVSVGAPPDDFSAQGQGWGLPPLDPRTLQEQGYEPFAQMLRANMRASGAIRIDHVMGLARLFWIPEGESPVDGAYVAYPLDDMLAVLALESQRAQCLVIGEDLGTVPEGFRERLAEACVLSYKLMYFEKDYDGDQHFRSPAHYAATSLVGANTHDLPTLRGFWTMADLALRDALGLMPSPEFAENQRSERKADKQRLLDALAQAGLLPDGIRADQPDAVVMDDTLVAAIHRFLARADSRILMANLEDMVGQVEQMNLPGTDRDLYPNWRRRLAVPLDKLGEHPGVRSVAAAIACER